MPREAMLDATKVVNSNVLQFIISISILNYNQWVKKLKYET